MSAFEVTSNGTLFVAHTPRPVHDPDVQRELAHRLVSGALHVVPLPAAEASVLALEVQEDEPKKAQPTPFKKKKTWIEILLVDEQEQPVADRRYRITLPDGVTVKEGRTDARGHARLEEIDPGTCKVSFPDMDRGVWRRA